MLLPLTLMADVTFQVGYTRLTSHHRLRQKFHIRRALKILKEQSLTPSGSLIGLQGNPGYTHEQGTSLAGYIQK